VAAGTVKWFNDEKGWGFIAVMASLTSLFTTRRFKVMGERRSLKDRPSSSISSPAIAVLGKRVVLN